MCPWRWNIMLPCGKDQHVTPGCWRVSGGDHDPTWQSHPVMSQRRKSGESIPPRVTCFLVTLPLPVPQQRVGYFWTPHMPLPTTTTFSPCPCRTPWHPSWADTLTEQTVPNGPGAESAENRDSSQHTSPNSPKTPLIWLKKQSGASSTMTDATAEEDKDPDIELFVKVGVSTRVVYNVQACLTST